MNATNEKRIVFSSLALLVDSKIKYPMLFFFFLSFFFITLYGDCAPIFYLFFTIDLFAMDPHIIFIRPTLKQSPKTTFIASRTHSICNSIECRQSVFFSFCFCSFHFYYFVWNINPVHNSNSTIYVQQWMSRRSILLFSHCISE